MKSPIITLEDYSTQVSRQEHIDAIPENDGVTHYNTHFEQARTDLGRQVSFRYKAPFIHPALGEFYSIEAFWHYIVAKERKDVLRYISSERFVSSSEIQNHERVRVPNFYAHMADAFYHRVDQDPKLKEALINSTLPFGMYYIFEGSIKQVPIKSLTKSFHLGSIHYIRDVFRGVVDYQAPDHKELIRD